MDIIVAYFHPLFRPEVVKQDFEQIRSAGASSILYTVHEQEEQRAPRDFERGLRLAHDAGLKINLGLGRFGNLFAGPLQMPSWYTFRHLQSRVMDQHGRYHEMSCFNHQSFRSWVFREVERFLATYPISGVLIDEPGGLEVTCYCPTCRALCPDVTDLVRFRRRSMTDFLGELCTYIKQINPHVKTTVVLRPQDVNLAEDLVTIEPLDTLGCHLFWNILQEDVAKVEQWGREIVEVTRQAGKHSQLWLQNFSIDARHEFDMEIAFAKILGLEPDEVGCYYFWRNNENPTRVWELSRRLLRRVPRRQMRWRTHTLTPPATYLPVGLPSKVRERLATVSSPAPVLVTELSPVELTEPQLIETASGEAEILAEEVVGRGVEEAEPAASENESAEELTDTDETKKITRKREQRERVDDEATKDQLE